MPFAADRRYIRATRLRRDNARVSDAVSELEREKIQRAGAIALFANC